MATSRLPRPGSTPRADAPDAVTFKGLRFRAAEELRDMPEAAGQREVQLSLTRAQGDTGLVLSFSAPLAALPPDARTEAARRAAMLELLDQAVVSIEE